MRHYDKYVPLPVNLIIVSVPEVVTVGLPVVVAEYPIVGTFKITTPDPPAPPTPCSGPEAPPPPLPVFAVAAFPL